MTDKELLELYSDYLISAFGQTTATGLSALLDGQVSHDQVQRFLASPKRTSADLWQIIKPNTWAKVPLHRGHFAVQILKMFLNTWVSHRS